MALSMFDMSNNTLADLAARSLPSYAKLDVLATITVVSFEKQQWASAAYFVENTFTFSTLWKVLLFTWIVANFKNFPLIYHLRLLNAVRFVLRSQRSPHGPTPQQLFQPIITSSKASLLETDCYLHKSNSTYFSDVDVARAHLLTTLFGRGIEKIRGGTTAIVRGKVPSFGVALGAVTCVFRKELKPYETYDMWSRILAWDDKWIYIVTHFVKKGANVSPHEFSLYPQQSTGGKSTSTAVDETVPSSSTSQQNHISSHSKPDGSDASSSIAASALSKLVFKNGRITISPKTMLELSGLLPSEPGSSEKTQSASIGRTTDTQPDDGVWERIEEERQHGLRVAEHLGSLSALHNEFRSEQALGRHTDGSGIPGCVATLAQLGHLSRYQLV